MPLYLVKNEDKTDVERAIDPRFPVIFMKYLIKIAVKAQTVEALKLEALKVQQWKIRMPKTIEKIWRSLGATATGLATFERSFSPKIQ
jgi:hypothetical protein